MFTYHYLKGRPLHEGVDWNYSVFPCKIWIFSRPLHEGVDWNHAVPAEAENLKGRPLHEGVDWNISYTVNISFCTRRPLHEGVDWNRAWLTLLWLGRVALFMRAWIEINQVYGKRAEKESRPLHEGVDWNIALLGYTKIGICRPLHEGVDWNICHRPLFPVILVALFMRAWIEIIVSR